METINLEVLIKQGEMIRKGLNIIKPSSGVVRTFKVYQLEDPKKYHYWVTTCYRYLNQSFPNDPCVSSFFEASKAFEDQSNHYSPQPLEKMIGILESCLALPSIHKNNNFEDEIIRLENKRHLYMSFTSDSVNAKECVEAYLNWYSDSLVLFDQYFQSNNEDMAKFRSVDNSCNGYGLRDNYNDIQASYFVLLNRIRQGTASLINETQINSIKPPLLFISHSSRDEDFVEKFVTLLQTLGFNKSNLFCSSVEGYGIDEGSDIFETLRKKFQENNIYVVYVLSEHYYSSAACLNEMGAAWMLKSDYSTIITPGFSIPQIKGAINPNKMAIVINDKKHVRSVLNKFKERLVNMFLLDNVDDDIVWENNRNKFLVSVQT